MAEETKTKTSSRSKVEKPIVPVVETVIVAEENTENVPASEIQEVIAEPEPVEVESSADIEVEAMGKRGRRSKSELEARYRHEFEVALSNEPQFEVQLRDQLREKLSKLK